MSTEPHDPPSRRAETSEGRASRPTTLIAGFVAVAAVAALSGAVVANSVRSDDDTSAGATPSTSGQEAGAAEGTTTADTVVATSAVGETRGLDDVHQGGDAERENVLVDTDWLAERIDAGLEESDVVLVEVSEEQASSELTRYPEGHIEGSQYLPWTTSFFQANTREFITQDQFTELGQTIGLNPDTTLVLYGDNNNWFAAYAAWVFKLHGAEDVRLLDGGRLKWEVADGRELVQEVPQPTRGAWEAKAQNFDLRAFKGDVVDIANGDVDASLVDIRSTEEYDGEVGADQTLFPGEGAAVWGHVPGAVNVPWASIVDPDDGTFLSNEEIAAVYEDAGVDLDGPIVAYCRIGERASHTWYALSQLLGKDVKVYDGSWSEYGNAVGVPVANNSGARGGTWGPAAG